MKNVKINYEDLVRINAELKKKNNRFHLSYRDESTACVEPPGECCRTEQMETEARQCIEEYYRVKNIFVQFSEDGLYFVCESPSGCF